MKFISKCGGLLRKDLGAQPAGALHLHHLRQLEGLLTLVKNPTCVCGAVKKMSLERKERKATELF